METHEELRNEAPFSSVLAGSLPPPVPQTLYRRRFRCEGNVTDHMFHASNYPLDPPPTTLYDL